MQHTNSENAYGEAVKYISGGVNSPVRSLTSVGAIPLFIKTAKKAEITDVDDNRYTDFCLSWGVFIIGHSHPQVNRKVKEAIDNGTSYGIPTLQETELAKMVNRHFPSMEKIRFVSSGTEAVMSAIRVARGFTKRNLIVKFDGCYHGHADHLLVSSGSGVVNLAASSSAGVPDDFTKYTVSIPFNDKQALEQLFTSKGNEIAAVIVEPVPANMGVVLPENSFLQFLRDITTKYGSLLIFDEVITGFRLSAGGVQQLFGIKPDMTTLGKIVGGGFPAAAFGGSNEIMSMLAPEGSVYQAGTLSGNPIAMTAGIETIHILERENFYADLEEKSHNFFAKLEKTIEGHNVRLNYCGSMFTLFFNKEPISSFEDAKKSDIQLFARFFRHMMDNNIYISPSQFEANFISEAHTDEQLSAFVQVVDDFLTSE